MPRNPAQVAYASDLQSELERRIRGEVRFDAGSRALYATDASNYRQVPIGVVLPLDAADVIETVDLARKFGAPILARGGGTSLAGQCCNVAIVMDMSKYMHRIIDLDPIRRRARVQPGVILDDLRNAAKKYNLTFAPDPATHNHCTLGGMIGNNSCGVHSLMGGRTLENVEELEILTYDGLRMTVGATTGDDLQTIIREGGRRGEIFAGLQRIRDQYAGLIRTRYPKIPRRVSGFSLDQLLPENNFHVARALVGTESTCVIVLEAKLKLVHWPPMRSLLVLGYKDIFTGADQIPDILSHQPIALEGVDDVLVDDMKKKKLHPENLELLPEGNGWLLVEFGGESKEEADAKARGLMQHLSSRATDRPAMKLFDDPNEEGIVWKIRESGLGATARVPGEGETWEGWEDSAVPPAKVGSYLRDFRKLLDSFGYKGALYGHLGQGCLHTRINFDLVTPDGVRKFRSFIEEAAGLVLRYGGSFSGEHGDGQSRGELLPRMFGPELVQAFREFKALWDPQWKMNPGKVVAPYKLDENLRLGPDYNHPEPETHFNYPEDKHSFAFAMTRCVGVGECRKQENGTMCPSYMVTREEMHSTRGRAHLLFEMLEGDPLKKGWRDDHVREALDLCFACKACKSECPVNVDMAAYKSEFLAHYYQGRLRPLPAYTMGWIYWWARAAAAAPGLVNWAGRTAPFSRIAKLLSGMSSKREIPKFAAKTFTGVRRSNGNSGDVILWPDTFNNHFHPQVLHAAFDSLRRLGYHPQIPSVSVCCGRPLYDFGFLSTAKDLLLEILNVLRNDIRLGKPVVVLEPSCASVFRDEMPNLLPQNSDALRLSRQTFLLSEFLEKKLPDVALPQLHNRAVIHGHCHQKSIFGMTDEEKVLRRLGLDYELLDSGCCGMAGAFGFEADHYDISMKAGERVLLPRIRSSGPDTLIITNGFSCREQIAQGAGRHSRHLAEVLDMAFKVGIRDHQVAPERPPRAA